MKFKRGLLLFLVALVGLSVIWFSYKGRWFESLLGGIYKVFFSVEAYLVQNVREFFSTYFSLVEIKKENQFLREEVLILRQKLNEAIEAGRLCKEYERFLKTVEGLKYPKVFARIIYKAIDPFSDFILIDRGSRDGIQTQMVVLALVGERAVGLVGQVVEVYPTYSKVMLLSDPAFAADVKVVRTGERAILRGKATPNLALEYLPLYSQAQPKDVIITSGQDALFPPNLLVGELISLSKDAQGLFKRGEVRAYVDLYNLNWVAVLINLPEIPLLKE